MAEIYKLYKYRHPMALRLPEGPELLELEPGQFVQVTDGAAAIAVLTDLTKQMLVEAVGETPEPDLIAAGVIAIAEAPTTAEVQTVRNIRRFVVQSLSS